MGRAEREERESRARYTINRAIPEVLRNSIKARHGLAKSELIAEPQSVVKTHTNAATSVHRPDLKIRISQSDCLTVAAALSERHYATSEHRSSRDEQHNVAIHNMGSATTKAGGFVNGSNGQEEFLCARSTLYASLFDEFYALPTLGGIYSPDILVFRNNAAIDLPRKQRYFIDVITAGLQKHPDQRGRYDEREAACSCGVSYCDDHRSIIVQKMKSVLRIAQMKGVNKLVLGAWGVGVMHHPVEEVAKAWRKVISGAQRQKRPNPEQWEGINEIIFATPDPAHRRVFEKIFDGVLSYDPIQQRPDSGIGMPHAESPRDANLDKLIAEAQVIEYRMQESGNAFSRSMMNEQLREINRKIAASQAAKAFQEDPMPDEIEDIEDDFIVAGSDGEDNSFYTFGDHASDSPASDDAPGSEIYEFRFGGPGISDSTADEDDEDFDGHAWIGLGPSPQIDPTTGWFSGSIDELHDLIRNKKFEDSVSPRSPLVREASNAVETSEATAINGFLARFQRSEVVDQSE